MRPKVRTPYLLLALLVAAFVTFYPQLDAAGYCDDGGCPEVSYPSHAAGAVVVSGASFVVAALGSVPVILPARLARFEHPITPPEILRSTILSPETPPPRTPA